MQIFRRVIKIQPGKIKDKEKGISERTPKEALIKGLKGDDPFTRAVSEGIAAEVLMKIRT